jgi:hypothetical protein
VPGQPVWAYGVEVLVATLLAAMFQVHAMRVIGREANLPAADRALKAAAGVVPLAAFLIGGVLIVGGASTVGLVAVAVGSILAVIAAILMAWVVLVELLR